MINKIKKILLIGILGHISTSNAAPLEIPTNGKIDLNITSQSTDYENDSLSYRYEVLDTDKNSILYSTTSIYGSITSIPPSVFKGIYNMPNFQFSNTYYIRLITSDGKLETTSNTLKEFKVKRGIEKILANSNIVYSCDAGWNLNGSTCYQVRSVPQDIQVCPDDSWSLESNGSCTKTVTDVVLSNSTSTFNCPVGYDSVGSGSSMSCTKDRVVTTKTCPTGLPYKSGDLCYAAHPSITYYLPSTKNFTAIYYYTESTSATYFYNYFFPKNFCSTNDLNYGNYCAPSRKRQQGNYVFAPYSDSAGVFYDARKLGDPNYKRAVDQAWYVMKKSQTGYYIINSSTTAAIETTTYEDYYSSAPIETVEFSCINDYNLSVNNSTCSKEIVQVQSSSSAVEYINQTFEKPADSSLKYTCPNGYSEYLSEENCFKYVD